MEHGLREVGQEVAPTSVLIRIDGLAVAATITARTEGDARGRGHAVIFHMAAAAGIESLGTMSTTAVQPARRPAS
jgi:hypothetical protein